MLGTPNSGAPKAFAVIRYGRESPIPSIIPWSPSPFDLMIATGNMQGLYMLLPSTKYESITKGGFLIYNNKRLSLHETYYQ
jgi:hypothetical protein